MIVEGGDPDVVSVGSHVVIEDGDGGRLEVEISGLGGDGTTSPSSPLGAALLGRRVGETVEVAAPQGAWQATIVEIRARVAPDEPVAPCRKAPAGRKRLGHKIGHEAFRACSRRTGRRGAERLWQECVDSS